MNPFEFKKRKAAADAKPATEKPKDGMPEFDTSELEPGKLKAKLRGLRKKGMPSSKGGREDSLPDAGRHDLYR